MIISTYTKNKLFYFFYIFYARTHGTLNYVTFATAWHAQQVKMVNRRLQFMNFIDFLPSTTKNDIDIATSQYSMR